MSCCIQDFANSFPSLTVRAVHNYWAKKAAASKLPLLQRFWYDKPWARLVALTGTLPSLHICPLALLCSRPKPVIGTHVCNDS